MAEEEIDEQAEELRLLGNEAFANKKWEEAIDQYQESLSLDGDSKNSAKVYSNLAAALCKINKYDDAIDAAKNATKVNPKWAKGYWRLGSIYELKKDFLMALNNYEKAVEKDTDESTAVYKKAFKRMLDRLGCEKKDGEEGYWSVQLPPTSLSVQSRDEYPAFVAWERVMKKTNNLKDVNKLFPQYIREGETVTSLQWMSQGMHYWYSAMMCQLGEMAGFANDKEMGTKLESLKMQMTNGSISRSTFDTKRFELTGCPPSQGDEFQGLLEGLIHLGGDTIPLEMGSGKFIPSPEWLKDYRPQQYVAVLMCILYEIVGCRSALNVGNIYKPAAGEDLVFSQSICGSAWSFLENAGQTNGGIFEFPKKGVTPEEAITFIKKKLDEGKTWENGIRKYVSCLYRGTILSAWLTRLVAGLAVALPEMKWARSFIELADKEWNVSENESYEMHGSCFRPSFQVNIMCMELQTAETLRNDDEPNLDEIVYEFKLAQQIINYAKTVQPPKTNDFKKHMFYVTFGRKPLAFACGRLGNNMNMLNYNQELLEKAIEAAGLMDSERDDNLLSFLVERSGGVGFRSSLAETYHEAAKAQLQDDKEAAILWWCYAAHLVDCGGYTMGHLRAGINNAVVASQRLDPLFVLPGPWKGSVYQKEALLVARYYQDETDDFILPQLQRSRRPDGKLSVFIDGNLLCYDLNQGYRISNKREREQNKKKDDYLDVSAVKEEIDQEMKSSDE